MAQQNENEEITAAWRALVGRQAGDGWQTIPIAPAGPCRLFAARHFPEGGEALLVGFNPVSLPTGPILPQGRGFSVARVDPGDGVGPGTWLALSREPTGDPDLFSMMVNDLIRTLVDCRSVTDEALFHQFLDRIRAWQEFMRRGDSGLLSNEAEIGLFGELILLGLLLDLRQDAGAVLASWQGPLDGIQDFLSDKGAIEVKSTTATGGFPVTISTLEQLDESIRPIFLAAIRLSTDGSGDTLSGLVAEIRRRLHDNVTALSILTSRLINAGYLEPYADRYTRRFALVSIRILPVAASFPRLTRANVPDGIRKAHYELDIDQIPADAVTVDDVVNQLWVD